MKLQVDIPDELWFKFREAIKRKYGRFRGLVPDAVKEALEIWIQLPKESIPVKIKHKASPTKVLSTMPRIKKPKPVQKPSLMTDCINFHNGECLHFRKIDSSICNESCRLYRKFYGVDDISNP